MILTIIIVIVITIVISISPSKGFHINTYKHTHTHTQANIQARRDARPRWRSPSRRSALGRGKTLIDFIDVVKFYGCAMFK